MFVGYLLSGTHCVRHWGYNHEQDSKTDWDLPPWDLNFRGHGQHARKCLMTFLSLLFIFLSSIQLKLRLTVEATSPLNLKRVFLDLIFLCLVNICWLCLASIHLSFLCRKSLNFLWEPIPCVLFSAWTRWGRWHPGSRRAIEQTECSGHCGRPGH